MWYPKQRADSRGEVKNFSQRHVIFGLSLSLSLSFQLLDQEPKKLLGNHSKSKIITGGNKVLLRVSGPLEYVVLVLLT